jgi:hypothetical protein
LASSPGNVAGPPDTAWHKSAEPSSSGPYQGSDRQEFGDTDVSEQGAYAGRAAGRLQRGESVLAPYQLGQPAVLGGQFRQAVQPRGEPVRPVTALGRPAPTGAVRATRERGGQVPEVPAERRPPGLPFGPAAAPRGGRRLAPQPFGPDPLDRRGRIHPAAGLGPRRSAERVHVEIVVREAAHQAVAPRTSFTSRIRVTTLGE